MVDMNLEQARHNMIVQQIRPWDVLDERVLNMMVRVPREAFVPEAYRALAFTDMEIPLGNDQRMMAPRLEARLLQALNIRRTDTALEIGTGSGYLTALLAGLGRHVYSVELYPEFTEAAAARLARQRIENVTLETGDAAGGWELRADYDVIAITGSLPILPEGLRHQLKIGGRLFAVIGDAPIMDAVLVTRLGRSEWRTETLFETMLPPLLNAVQPNRFML